MRVVLGTSSRWRRGLFQKHFPQHYDENGFMSADIDEKAIRHDDPEQMVVLIAEAKLDALLARLGDGFQGVVVCLDQVVRCDGEVREKPVDEAEARRFLQSYRDGHAAECINGVVVHNTCTGRRFRGVENASVWWSPFSDEAVDEIIGQGLIFKSAGGFLVDQAPMSTHVQRTSGAMDAIEGLPVKLVGDLLAQALAPLARISHVLFDMDGLLLDTESLYTKVQQDILARYGKEFTWELKAQMMGKKAEEAAAHMLRELGLEDKLGVDEFVGMRNQMLAELFPNSQLMPGAERLVRHLHAHGVPIAVATSSNRANFNIKTQKHQDLFGLFHHIITGDMVGRGKPFPDIFLTARGGFGGDKEGEGEVPDTQACLVFEDAPLGVEAALAAGMHVVMVPDPNLDDGQKNKAHQRLASLEAFVPEVWGLPPFEE